VRCVIFEVQFEHLTFQFSLSHSHFQTPLAKFLLGMTQPSAGGGANLTLGWLRVGLSLLVIALVVVIFADRNSAPPSMEPSCDLRVHDYDHDSEYEKH